MRSLIWTISYHPQHFQRQKQDQLHVTIYF